jgi:hypothetical protein
LIATAMSKLEKSFLRNPSTNVYKSISKWAMK